MAQARAARLGAPRMGHGRQRRPCLRASRPNAHRRIRGPRAVAAAERWHGRPGKQAYVEHGV
eukprot:1259801-Lingulodinium_polyedra.AAC.1